MVRAMRNALRAVPFAALLACTLAQQPTPPPLAGSRPNILFVFSDDHACSAIGAYGSTFGATPVIDRLAENGALFTANYCGNGICGPSRASILTGLHSHGNGFTRNGNVFDGTQTTFPQLLQRAGYQTAIVGKWHLESQPTGFDHWIVLPDQGQYYNPDFLTKDGRVRKVGHATDVTTALAIEWLEQRDASKPFVLMCQHKAPHRNWLPAPSELGLYRDGDLPEPPTLFPTHAGRLPARAGTAMEIGAPMTLHYDLMLPPSLAEQAALQELDRSYANQRARMDDAQRAAWDAAFAAEDAAFRQQSLQGKELVRWKFQRYLKNYLRCVRGVDRSTGELLAWLDAHPDVKRNTLVVYSSDQGFFLGENGWFDKRWMDEPSFRMPLVVAWPGRIEAGRKVAQLTQNIDFAPTFLDLAGVAAPEGTHGTSLLPLLAGEPPADWRDAIYYHYYESHAVHRVPAMYGVRTATHKLVHYYEPEWDRDELFDLRSDPDERRDLARDPAQTEVLAGLRTRLQQLRTQYGDDTGTLGDGAFPVTAGIARAVRDGEQWRVWANASGGYLLHRGERTVATTFSTTLQTVAAKPLRNGFIVLGGADARRDQVRAGIEFGARKLVVLGPDGKQRAEVALPWDGDSAIELVVRFEPATHRVTARALGVEVVAQLPAAWTALTAWGYGVSNSETRFAPLRLQ